MQNRSALFAAAVITAGVLGTATAAPAQQSTPPAVATNAAGTRLPVVLEQIGAPANLLVLTDSLFAFTRVENGFVVSLPGVVSTDTPANATPGEQAEKRVEAQLTALVRVLPAGTVWIKLYLPAPGPGRLWRGDDVAALVFAQARLFGQMGSLPPSGQVEIMGKRVDQATAKPLITALGLKPLYLVSNTRRRIAATGAEPWSPLSREQWGQLSNEDRRAYGQQQAAQIMALPPEERDAVLEQMKQHDRYFDSVKDPLEKAVGHDL